MYEIDLSTLMLIGIDDESTRVVTLNDEFIVKQSCKKIIDNSCKFFGSSLSDRIKATNRIVKMSMKTPIIIEDTRNIIFFPLKSTREKNSISLNYSYYIVDNQVTRSLILDYEINMRRKSLEK